MANMQIESISITAVSFSLNDDFHPSENLDLSFDVAVNGTDHEGKKIVDVIVRTPEDEAKGNLPFFFNITGRGVFEFSEEVSEEEDDQLTNINCPAIIFPYIREQVADLTRRSGYPPLHLPPVNFIKMHQAKISE